MAKLDIRWFLAFFAAFIAVIPQARAQWAVVDAPAIVQLIQQVQTLQQQLATARDQLSQARQALKTTTGGRGMEQLLSGTQRNYLPSNWNQLTGVFGGTGGYGALIAEVKGAMAANAVLSPQRLAAMSRPEQQQIQAARQWSAMQQAISRGALANASGRFAAIQSLTAAIATAADQKAILDLQARISTELGMLQNEQIKNQALYQATQAEMAALAQLAREQAIAGHGRFETRFQPVP